MVAGDAMAVPIVKKMLRKKRGKEIITLLPNELTSGLILLDLDTIFKYLTRVYQTQDVLKYVIIMITLFLTFWYIYNYICN